MQKEKTRAQIMGCNNVSTYTISIIASFQKVPLFLCIYKGVNSKFSLVHNGIYLSRNTKSLTFTERGENIEK